MLYVWLGSECASAIIEYIPEAKEELNTTSNLHMRLSYNIQNVYK